MKNVSVVIKRLSIGDYIVDHHLEGTGKELTEAGVSRKAMRGGLITIGSLLGIPVLRSSDPCESAHLIIYASRQIKSAARGIFQRRGYQAKGKCKQQLFILHGLPGVGSERAIRLLDAFGSVWASLSNTLINYIIFG
jgi:DNA excision repair protein ERCC-4